MPIKPKKACAYPGCGRTTTGRYCEKHQEVAKQRTREYNRQRGSSTALGYGQQWRKIRALVLADEPLCRECSKSGRVKPATDVHHDNGDPTDNRRENLVPLCRECHSRHTATYQAFGRKG